MTVPFEIFRGLSFVLMMGASVVTTYAVLCAPLRVANRLGMRGLKRQRAIGAGGPWSKLEPVVRWLGTRVSGMMSDRFHDSLDRQLTLAGDYLGLTPPEYVALSILGGAFGFAIGLALATVTHMGGFIVAAATFFGAGSVYMTITGEAETRLKRIGRGLPYAIDLMALGMSAGLDFPGAIRQFVEKSSDPFDPLVEELAWMLQKMSLGNTRKQVLGEFAERAPIGAVLEFVGAVVQAEERGHPVAKVLQIQATASRERRSVQAEERAAKAGVALMLPLVLLFMSILLLILAPIVLRLSKTAMFSRS
jgi:tight adherence protein C